MYPRVIATASAPASREEEGASISPAAALGAHAANCWIASNGEPVRIAPDSRVPYLWTMLRFLARFVGVWLLAGALVAGVVDGAKSIAASTVALTSVGESWAGLARLLDGTEAPPEGPATWPFDAIAAWLLSAPTFAVLAVAGAALLAAGRRRRSTYLGREYAA